LAVVLKSEWPSHSWICFTVLPKALDAVMEYVPELPEVITSIVGALGQAIIDNLPTIIAEIVNAVPQSIAGTVSTFGSLMYKIVEIGGNIVKGLWSGIQQLASWLWDKVSGWISSIWDGICDFFGIHSPSKEMAWVGEMLVKGLAGSIDDNGDEAVKAAEGMADSINGVMGDLAHDMQTALPTDFDVNGSIHSAVDGVVGKAASAALRYRL